MNESLSETVNREWIKGGHRLWEITDPTNTWYVGGK